MDFGRLKTDDWMIFDGVVDEALRRGWSEHARALHAAGKFHKAGIGGGLARQLDVSIRADETCWLDATRNVDAAILRWLDECRADLNQQHLLGLQAVEAHFAKYPVDAHYLRHVDNAFGSNRRVMSLALYLNDEWCSDWGGELVMDPLGRNVCIEPYPGRAVFFVSENLEHEVRPTKTERWSLTAWFTR